MLIRKLAYPLDVNTLQMSEFRCVGCVWFVVVIVASQGNADHYRAELTFVDVEYMACPMSFHDVQLRILPKPDSFTPKRSIFFVRFFFNSQGVRRQGQGGRYLTFHQKGDSASNAILEELSKVWLQEYPDLTVYFFEKFPIEDEIEPLMVVARDVEITVHSSSENLGFLEKM